MIFGGSRRGSGRLVAGSAELPEPCLALLRLHVWNMLHCPRSEALRRETYRGPHGSACRPCTCPRTARRAQAARLLCASSASAAGEQARVRHSARFRFSRPLLRFLHLALQFFAPCTQGVGTPRLDALLQVLAVDVTIESLQQGVQSSGVKVAMGPGKPNQGGRAPVWRAWLQARRQWRRPPRRGHLQEEIGRRA